MNDEAERELDGYLIALAQGGSREAFDRLARRWTPKLVRYTSRVTPRQDRLLCEVGCALLTPFLRIRI